MTLGDELRDLAAQIAGAGWRDRFPNEWTPEQEAVYSAASQEEKTAYLDEMFDRPLPDAP